MKFFLALLTLTSCLGAVGELEANQKTLDALKAHDQAVHIHDQWIRDPHILLHEGEYLLTGTTLESPPDRTVNIPLWRSRDLVNWEKLGPIWKPEGSTWLRELEAKKKPLLIWAPEIHFLNGKWVIVHTTNAQRANLLVGESMTGPFTEPMGADFGHHHDPTIFTETDGSHWLVWGCTTIQKLRDDFSGLEGPKFKIGPSNRKMGHEGSVIYRMHDRYVLFGTAWSTDKLRQGTYNLYYCTSEKLTGPYGPRRFAGRCLGHSTLFEDKDGRWWATAFLNGKPVPANSINDPEVSEVALTLNHQGTTLVPLDIQFVDSDVTVTAKDAAYRKPGPEEKQDFSGQ